MIETTEIKAKITYSKTQQSRYIAHLDTIDVICKALRRMKLPYLVTQGCHVRPKISFGAPLPLGHSSRCEQFVLSLAEIVDSNWLKSELTKQLPNGMEVMSVEIPCVENKKGANGDLVKYLLGFTAKATEQQALSFLTNPETSFSQISKGRTKTYKPVNALQKIVERQHGMLHVIEAEFVQGKPDVPSVSKIITALADFLGGQKNDLVLIERVSLQKL
ncbi:MAG: hypothetical protein Kow0029_17610 [Candidatus Rifleibacteriota bacterium]